MQYFHIPITAAAIFGICCGSYELRSGEELFRYVARGGGDRPGAGGESGCGDGDKEYHPCGLLPWFSSGKSLLRANE